MKGRRYINRVEVLRVSNVPDSFGGNTVQNQSLGFSWCNIKTVSVDRVSNLGLNENNLVIEVNLRERDDITYSIKDTIFRYKSIDYNLLRIEPVNLDDREIKIICSGKQ